MNTSKINGNRKETGLKKGFSGKGRREVDGGVYDQSVLYIYVYKNCQNFSFKNMTYSFLIK